MMPIYEYKCTSCDHITEQLRNPDRRSKPAACEECGHPAKVQISKCDFDMNPDKAKKLRQRQASKQGTG